VQRTDLSIPTRDGRHLGGWVAGDGPPVVLAHGGPGLGYEHLDDLAEELALGHRVAFYQQRGLAPSTTEGEFTVAEAVSDVAAVLDHLGWERAWFVGHSWGGHLAFHVAAAIPARLLGVLAVDPLGVADGGGMDAFGAEMLARVPERLRARAEELDAKDTAGEITDEEQVEYLGLFWPSYFADPASAPPAPPLRVSDAAKLGLFADLFAVMPTLEACLGGIEVPVGVLVGARSPMPADSAGGATAARIPGAWVESVAGAGHFPWVEVPGCALRALRRLENEQVSNA
jgi:pimeloyl-ACP methyl ester carboxylesterase